MSKQSGSSSSGGGGKQQRACFAFSSLAIRRSSAPTARIRWIEDGAADSSWIQLPSRPSPLRRETLLLLIQRNHGRSLLGRSAATHLAASSSSMMGTMMDSLTTTTTTTAIAAASTSPAQYQQQQFEPVLNLPALSIFLLVAVLFVALQWRISAISTAAEARTVALDRLRQLKARQLAAGDEDSQVQEAEEAYRAAYWKVEELRTVIPGVRVVSPPSQSLNRRVMEENEAAAQQFLGIAPLEQEDNNSDDNKEKTLSPLLTAVLAVVALSQIALLVLFVATDPMLMGGGVLGDTNSLMEGVVDAVSGLE